MVCALPSPTISFLHATGATGVPKYHCFALTDVSRVHGDVEGSLTHVLTLRGRVQSPRLLALQLGLPGRQTHHVNLKGRGGGDMGRREEWGKREEGGDMGRREERGEREGGGGGCEKGKREGRGERN